MIFQSREQRRAFVLALPIGLFFSLLFHAEHVGEQLRGLWPLPLALPLLAFELATALFATLVAYLIIRAHQREREVDKGKM